jgi:ABC-2 type transport system ATP-binding protein
VLAAGGGASAEPGRAGAPGCDRPWPRVLAGGRIVAQGSVAELRDQIAGQDEVRWARSGQRFRCRTPDGASFVRGLFAAGGEDIRDLEVRRASLEDTYLTLVRQTEAGRGTAATGGLEGAA